MGESYFVGESYYHSDDDDDDDDIVDLKRSPGSPPLKPQSAFRLFFGEEANRLWKATKNGTQDAVVGPASEADLRSAIGQRIMMKWGTLSKDEKAKYTEKANEDRQRYEREMEEHR